MTKIEELEQKLIILNKMHTKAKEDFESISNELNECQKALAELKESKKEGKWKPKKGEEYWYRDDIGAICWTMWDSCEIDIWRYKNIPLFKTKEQCQRYWHFMDTVKEKSYEFTADEWKNVDIAKWRMGYSFQDGEWEIVPLCGYYIPGAFYFKTREDAQYIIDNFKDELMEYWI